VDDDAIIARERVEALPVLAAELYHHARDHDGDRALFFARHHATARAAAVEALRVHVAAAKHAVIIGKQPALPSLEAIVRSHAMIHTAEGALWRDLFAEACASHGLSVMRIATAPLTKAERWLAAGRERFGAPWTAEIKAVAVAARHA
jgi:hypothetical protein